MVIFGRDFRPAAPISLLGATFIREKSRTSDLEAIIEKASLIAIEITGIVHTAFLGFNLYKGEKEKKK
jgi:hypothetical protein